MKKFSKILSVAIAAFAAVTMVSCGDEKAPEGPGPDPVEPPVVEPVDPDPVPENAINFTGAEIEGYYKGDFYKNETGNLWINFISEGIVYDPIEDEFTGSGYFMCLDFNTTISENPDFARLADGNYMYDDSRNAFTINVDESFLTKITDGQMDDRALTDASLKVSNSDGVTTISGKLVFNDGSEETVYWKSELVLYNHSDSGEYSNLKGNITEPVNLNKGAAIFYGNAFTESSQYYAIVLGDDDYDVEMNFGKGKSISLGLCVSADITFADGIPTGTYNLIIADEADDYLPGEALSGVYEPTYSGYYGCWYYHTAQMIEAAFKTGTVKVTQNSGSNYQIEYDFADGYGNTAKGQFSGKLLFADES